MEKNYIEITRDISANLKTLRKDIPDTMAGFSAMAQAASRDGALDKKTKELIALALGVAAHCDGCIGFHTEALIRLGASARKWKRRSAWRCTWAAAHRGCMPPTQSAPTSSSSPERAPRLKATAVSRRSTFGFPAWTWIREHGSANTFQSKDPEGTMSPWPHGEPANRDKLMVDKLTMRRKPLKSLSLILSLSKDEARDFRLFSASS